MIRFKRTGRHDITIVFDGHKAGHGNESLSVQGGVAVIYSGLGERADDVIKKIITKDRKAWIVVSSDKEIARHAWSVSAVPVPSDEFMQVVSGKVLKDSRDNVIPEELKTSEEADDEYYHAGKGNPYKLSRKEKIVRRALSRL